MPLPATRISLCLTEKGGVLECHRRPKPQLGASSVTSGFMSGFIRKCCREENSRMNKQRHHPVCAGLEMLYAA